jgi:protein ImuB
MKSHATKPSSAEIYAALLVREFPTQALLRLRPQLRTQPCVVMEGEPPLEQACSLNQKARVLGIACGMTRVEIDTFPSLVVLPRSRAEEATARVALLQCAGAFTPRIEDLSNNNSFLCVLDISGTEKLFGPPATLAKSVSQHAKALGFSASMAVSSNFHTAVSLVRSIPPGNSVVSKGEESAALSPLPLTVLDLAETNAETLSQWGIHTLGMLATLPEKALIARLGQEGKRLRQLARGELPHLFMPVEPAFTLKERMELDTPVELLDSLLFVIGVMLEQLILRASARIFALASVTITLSLEGDASHARTVRPALPTNDRQLWIKLLHLDLEAHPPHAAIMAIALDAEPGHTSKVQLGLFSPQLPEPMRLDVTLARIRSIVGEDSVGRCVIEDTPRRDGFQMQPFSVPSTNTKTAPIRSRSAVRQLRPIENIAVTLREQQPHAFHFRNQQYAVEHAYGPWLASGEWWRPTLWSNEQWDLVARAGDGSLLCCCLMHNLAQGCWQMVALYD